VTLFLHVDPCYFALHRLVALADPRLRPVLVFPIRTASRLLAGGRADGDHVTALLGVTRASILRSVIGGSTTTGLAKVVGVAPRHGEPPHPRPTRGGAHHNRTPQETSPDIRLHRWGCRRSARAGEHPTLSDSRETP